MDPRVLVAILSVVVLADLSVADKEDSKSALEPVNEVAECSASCFDAIKPIIDHIMVSKTTADEGRDLEDQLILLMNEIKIKDEQIHALSKINDEQRNTINTLTKNNDALIKAQNDNQELIRIINSESNERKNERKKIEENKIEIKIKDELIKKKDKEIQENPDKAVSKDAQNNDLASQISVITRNLIEANEKLSIRDEINSCTTAEKGIYHIKLPGMSAFEAPCNGSGWLVIQRRMDGSVNFNRGWAKYRDGFGNLTGEFFIGLEKLYQITQSSQYELLISLGKINGSTAFVKYDNFKIGSEENSYPLESVGNFSGDAGDSLKYDEKMKFSTFDRDNDMYRIDNCPEMYNGGWWFNNCGGSSLNGYFYKNGKQENSSKGGVIWGSWQEWNWKVSLTFVEMMIRPKPF
ncbi:fibrinogen-like protein 1 [Drosophila bipectinata]|uniref:fibrinogen-like protein 1 n=1 Tax=Drosophila bipectinata TaxID=42026 RepID=UPI001C8AF33E|nr:fibrinogen-like protein 1 [Drosophila bipectinata]